MFLSHLQKQNMHVKLNFFFLVDRLTDTSNSSTIPVSRCSDTYWANVGVAIGLDFVVNFC